MSDAMQGRPKNKHLVLIIDNNSKSIQVVSQIIDRAGYRVAAATSVNQAISMIANTPPDLILMDVVMPGENGFECCRTLKQAPQTRDIPIIMLTIKNDTEDIVQGFDAGAADYIAKPFNPEVLLARMDAQIELKQIGDQQVRLIEELEQALIDIRQLSDLIPICAHCKKIRGGEGYWEQVEEYIAAHSSARVMQSFCPECRQKHHS
jgi:PleD family two-component response regulator